MVPNNHDIFRNKVDFARAEFATELYKPKGRPRPREVKSQTGQNAFEGYKGIKGKKVPFHEKIGSPNE